MNKAIEAALFLHLLGVAVWIGGMIFAHFCLRPALGDPTPQLRLPLWEWGFGQPFWIIGLGGIALGALTVARVPDAEVAHSPPEGD